MDTLGFVIYSMLLVGPPGSGKSLLAARLPALLPPCEVRQKVPTARVHSWHTPVLV